MQWEHKWLHHRVAMQSGEESLYRVATLPCARTHTHTHLVQSQSVKVGYWYDVCHRHNAEYLPPYLLREDLGLASLPRCGLPAFWPS